MTIRIPKAALIIALLLLVGAGGAVGGYFYGEASVSRADIRREAADKAYKQGYRAASQASDDELIDEFVKGNRQGAPGSTLTTLRPASST